MRHDYQRSLSQCIAIYKDRSDWVVKVKQQASASDDEMFIRSPSACWLQIFIDHIVGDLHDPSKPADRALHLAGTAMQFTRPQDTLGDLNTHSTNCEHKY